VVGGGGGGGGGCGGIYQLYSQSLSPDLET